MFLKSKPNSRIDDHRWAAVKMAEAGEGKKHIMF